MKLRIEGREAELFSGNLAWMSRIKAMIIELRPDLVATHQIIEIIKNHGFRYIPSHSVFNGNIDTFVRM